MSTQESRRRWINLGEVIALAALIVSALGVWIAWKSSNQDKPTRVVEQRQTIPLMLRGKAEDDGRSFRISPVEPSHALESLTIAVPTSGSIIEVGSDGEFSSRAIEAALNTVGDRDGRPHRLQVQIGARYVEAGVMRRSSGNYVLTYRWEGGGLFGGRSLRLVSLGR